MKQKLWILTELFYPDETATAYILTNIARRMTEKYEVHVICGPVTSTSSTRSDEELGFFIHRTNLFNMNKDKLSHRVFRLLFISLILTLKLWKKCKKGDKALIVTNPAPIVPFVARIKHMRQFELTILVHDLFPENLIPAGILKNYSSCLYRWLLRIFNKSYAKADKIIVLGRDMKEKIIEKIQRYDSKADVKIITNWSDSDMFTTADFQENDWLEIQYAGNLGRVQGLMDFLELFYNARNMELKLSFWGDGVMSSTIRNYIDDKRLGNVELKRGFTREEQATIVGSCDLCLITLANGMYGLGVPSKTYNVMAAGKPVLYIGPEDSEVWRVIKENGIGFCFSPSDHEGIMTFLQSLKITDRNALMMMGEKAHLLASTVYTKDNILNQFLRFV